MGAYKYMSELYRKKQSDVMRYLLRIRHVSYLFICLTYKADLFSPIAWLATVIDAKFPSDYFPVRDPKFLLLLCALVLIWKLSFFPSSKKLDFFLFAQRNLFRSLHLYESTVPR